ncbi:MAG: acylphosphatase [Nanobdellota archaeon]
MKTAKKVIAKGRVQGVSFRYFIKKNADRLNIKGYVRNLSNGNVEAVFEGEDKNIKEMISLFEKGPSMAFVKKTWEEELNINNYSKFEITH